MYSPETTIPIVGLIFRLFKGAVVGMRRDGGTGNAYLKCIFKFFRSNIRERLAKPLF